PAQHLSRTTGSPVWPRSAGVTPAREATMVSRPDRSEGASMSIATTNPATGEVVQEFEPATEATIDAAIGRAADGFAVLRRTSFDQRAAWMRAVADVLDAEREDLARTMTTEMGKTLAASRAEVEKSARACRFYAEHAAAFLAD